MLVILNRQKNSKLRSIWLEQHSTSTTFVDCTLISASAIFDSQVLSERLISFRTGHLFSRKVTLGGRLVATKVVKMTEQSNEKSMKEDFKVSVGVSVKTPIGVGGSVKVDSQTSSSNATSETQINRNETQIFEAVGGDTILANKFVSSEAPESAYKLTFYKSRGMGANSGRL